MLLELNPTSEVKRHIEAPYSSHHWKWAQHIHLHDNWHPGVHWFSVVTLMSSRTPSYQEMLGLTKLLLTICGIGLRGEEGITLKSKTLCPVTFQTLQGRSFLNGCHLPMVSFLQVQPGIKFGSIPTLSSGINFCGTNSIFLGWVLFCGLQLRTG